MAKGSCQSASDKIKPLALEEVLREFIQNVLVVNDDLITVRMAMNNQEALPQPPFVLIALLHSEGLAFNSHRLVGEMLHSMNVIVRTYSIMFFGDGEGTMAIDMAETFCMAFNDNTLYKKWRHLPYKPLYAKFSEFVPMVNSEDQYSDRCDVIVKIEYNKIIKIKQ